MDGVDDGDGFDVFLDGCDLFVCGCVGEVVKGFVKGEVVDDVKCCLVVLLVYVY